MPQRFPDRFLPSEVGEIPEGWRVASIYEIADVTYGAAFSSGLFNEVGEGFPLIRIRDLATHRPEVFTTEEHPRKSIVRMGDIVAVWTASFVPTSGGGQTAC